MLVYILCYCIFYASVYLLIGLTIKTHHTCAPQTYSTKSRKESLETFSSLEYSVFNFIYTHTTPRFKIINFYPQLWCYYYILDNQNQTTVKSIKLVTAEKEYFASIYIKRYIYYIGNSILLNDVERSLIFENLSTSDTK